MNLYHSIRFGKRAPFPLPTISIWLNIGFFYYRIRCTLGPNVIDSVYVTRKRLVLSKSLSNPVSISKRFLFS